MLTATSKSEFPYAAGREFGNWTWRTAAISQKVFSWKINLRRTATELSYFLLNLLIPILVAFVYVHVWVIFSLGTNTGGRFVQLEDGRYHGGWVK